MVLSLVSKVIGILFFEGYALQGAELSPSTTYFQLLFGFIFLSTSLSLRECKRSCTETARNSLRFRRVLLSAVKLAVWGWRLKKPMQEVFRFWAAQTSPGAILLPRRVRLERNVSLGWRSWSRQAVMADCFVDLAGSADSGLWKRTGEISSWQSWWKAFVPASFVSCRCSWKIHEDADEVPHPDVLALRVAKFRRRAQDSAFQPLQNTL